MDGKAIASSSKAAIDDAQIAVSHEDNNDFGLRLPSRRKYFITVTSVAFLAGVGFGVMYAVRYSRRMRLEELRAATDAGIHHRSSGSSVSAPTPSTPLHVATSQGPLALFREMNKAAFVRFTGKDTGTQQDTPSILQKGPPLSERLDFQAPTTSAPPSILMRSPVIKRNANVPAASAKLAREADSLEDVPLGQTPAVLGAKALGIATAIVGVTALVSIEVVYRILGVKNTDELVDRLSMIVPVSERTVKTFEPVGRAAREALRGTFGDHDSSEPDLYGENEEDERNTGDHLGDVEDTLQQLDDAVDRGDTQTWFEVLSKRLNAERTFDIAERRRRIAAVDAQQNK